MYINIPETEEIYFSKTREYFKEVLSSYSIGNYRSAVVMLYSVTICDILLKLQELNDMYNDTIADSILKQIEKSRSSFNTKSKSKWEKELIDSVYEKTELLDLEAYTNLNHLYDYRNFSAHPALNENYELITPSQETTIALIKNTLCSVLVKPPIFIKKVVDMLTDDLKEKREIYKDKSKSKDLQIYLQNKYFSKMSLSMRCETFKAMWKFCFRAPDDDCRENILINRRATEMLIRGFQKEIAEYIRNHIQLFDVSSDNVCIINLISLLSRNELLYAEMSRDTKVKIDDCIEKNDSAKVVSWFKYSKIEEHLDFLKSFTYLDVEKEHFDWLMLYYVNNGKEEQLLDFYISLYGNSKNYDRADWLFFCVIEPYIEKMNYEQVVHLIELSNSNNQIYNRNASRYANGIIVKKTSELLGADFDFSKYPFFKFYKDDIKESESEETEIE